jgi:hypothetical protein
MKHFTVTDVTALLDEALRSCEMPDAPTAQRFLEARLATPLEGEVQLQEYRAASAGLAPGKHAVWFVVKDDPQSVFFDPETQLFGACWGPEQGSGTYWDLGFRSGNPFKMYVV